MVLRLRWKIGSEAAVLITMGSAFHRFGARRERVWDVWSVVPAFLVKALGFPMLADLSAWEGLTILSSLGGTRLL